MDRRARRMLRRFVHEFALPGLPALLLAAYPALHLYAHNIDQLQLVDIRPTLVLSLSATALLLAILTMSLRDVVRAAVVGSIFVIWFFSYGMLHNALEPLREVHGISLVRHRYLFPLWGLAWAAVALLVIKGKALAADSRIRAVNRYLMIVASVLVGTAVVQIAAHAFRTQEGRDIQVIRQGSGLLEDFAGLDELDEATTLPDIYYIVPDSYSRGDVLSEYYGYDNTGFLEALRARGFYVASDSRANYLFTFLSLASSLNMQYLDFLSEVPGKDSKDRTIPYQMIADSRVWRTLEKLGYRFVFASSGWGATDKSSVADVVLAWGDDAPMGKLGLRATEFETLWGERTALKPLMDAMFRKAYSRERILYTLDRLREVPDMPEPTFVFAHLLVPHQPFVFDRNDGPRLPNGAAVDGTVVDSAAYMAEKAYIDQVVFVNRALIALVDDILEKSTVEPIIMIQSDHGYWTSEAGEGMWGDDTELFNRRIVPVLNAYRLPDGGNEALYPSISPVNSFRVVLDHYFGADLGTIEDVSYYSNYFATPYDFDELPP